MNNLVLVKKDGRRKVRCEECGGLYEPAARELKALAAYGEKYACVCWKCSAKRAEFVWEGDREGARAEFRAVIREAHRLIAEGRMA